MVQGLKWILRTNVPRGTTLARGVGSWHLPIVHTQHHSDYIYITHPHTLQYGYAHGLAAIAPLLASSKAVPLPRPRLYRSSPPPHGALEVLAGRGVAPAVGLEQKRGTRAAAARR